MHVPVNPIQTNINQLQTLVVATEKYNHVHEHAMYLHDK